MTPATEAALIELGTRLAIDVLIPLLTRLVEGTQTEPVTIPGVAYEIVAGIERDWPDLSGDEKRLMAFDAIEQMLRNRGGKPAARDVNALLEVAVAQLGA